MVIAGHVFRFADFAINTSQDVHDTTGFAQAPWRTSVAGVRVGMITASGYFDDETDPNLIFAAADDQTGVTFTGTIKSGVTYSGTMILETASVGVSVNGVPVVSVSGRTTGPVAETVSGTT
jgi:predicted secreted protein